ncbi:MAG: SPFH domain-containing protein [Candidatus Heimdallarchaeota archaeon]|nr:SPFH domain-containing protein [Candidatus Heimdallarchaeota archaeon]MDH5646802.1 SPFH domain-containing protein [Candidatus Heimdallarchaeota archaeon]
MVKEFQTGLTIALSAFIIMTATIAIIKSRYRKFTNQDFVLRFRNGVLKNSGYGGGYFVLPLIDQLIVLTTTVQQLEVNAGEVITAENQDVRVIGFVLWRIENPEIAYQSLSGNKGSGVMTHINETISRLVESIVRTTVARLSLDQVLRERSLIIEALVAELVTVVGPMGIKINTAEIRHVDVLDVDLFEDLQQKYKQEARLNAENKKIETEKEIAKARALSSQEVQISELERDKVVVQETEKMNHQEEQRLRTVQELQKTREVKIATLEKEKLQVEAETKLMEIELQAEAKKRKHILENIQVEAQQKKLMAEATAEAIKIEAQAKLLAADMDAQAEIKLAEAKKQSLLAEAEGKKAILLAEAEGLREKVKAQGMVNEAMILQELVNQLPNIASSMKVGDINWLNMGGNNSSDGENSPLGIIPKNLLQVMALAKSFGLDLEGLMRSIRGQSPKNGNPEKLKLELPKLPPGISFVDLNGDGNVNGVDLNGNGTIDFPFPEQVTFIDNDGDGIVDALDLDGDGKPDIQLSELRQLIV